MSDNSRNAQFNSMESLLGANLDDLDDLPSFETPPPGVYILDVTTDVKEVNDKDAIEASYTIKEVVELKDPTTTPPVIGSKFSTLFTLNEFGVGKLKEFLAPFAKQFGSSNVQELIRDHIKDVTISAQVGNRKDKTDPDKVYPTVKILSIA